MVWNVLEIIFNSMEDRFFERPLKIDMWEIMFCPYVSMWAWAKKEEVAGFDLEFDLPCKVICNIYYSPA